MILSADFGTSCLKFSVLDQDLRTVHSEKEEYPYNYLPGEKVEIDPDAIWGALVKSCNRLDEKTRASIELICYDSFSPSLMLMDDTGNTLYPVVTHMDRRSRKQSEFICKKMGAEHYQSIAGVFPFTGGISLTTVLWFLKEMPELCARVERIGHLPTFLHKRLTGEWMVDLVNASMMGLYDTVHQSTWSQEILETFGIPASWLSEIHVPGTQLGALSAAAAKDLGLPQGIPVTVGTNDVVAAHAGAGNDRAGQVLNTAGSSDMVSVLIDKPVLNPNYYVRNAGKPGLWQIYATTSGGFAIDWFRKEFCKEMETRAFFDEYLPKCVELCMNNPVRFDPYLAEDRQSLELREGAWHGLRLSSSRDQMLASLLYSMQKVLSDTVSLAATQVEMDRVIKVTGGMTDDAVMSLKRAMFPGYTFELVDDCCVRGNAVMAQGIL